MSPRRPAPEDEAIVLGEADVLCVVAVKPNESVTVTADGGVVAWVYHRPEEAGRMRASEAEQAARVVVE